MKKNVFILIFIFTTIIVQSDGILFSWSEHYLIGMTIDRVEAAKSWTINDIIKKNLSVNEWPEIYLLLLAANQHKNDIIDQLIEQLTNQNQIKLKLTSRLIIWERIISGDILFEGKGIQINDDLFSVAGRANWFLRQITGKNFGFVKMTATLNDLKQLKTKWLNWRKGDKVDEYKNPYETVDGGFNEIKSLEALEALIMSLKKNPDKDKLIINCLKNLYNLTELPDDPSSPANFCNPDTYTHMYLKLLTGIEDKHEFKWWLDWWLKNKEKLEWDIIKGQFVIKK